VETEFIRYSLLHQRRNYDILEELEVDPIEKKLAQYKQKWLNHVSSMKDIYRKQLLDYRPNEHEGLDYH